MRYQQIILSRIIFCSFFLIYASLGTLAEADIISDYEATIKESYINEFEPGQEKKPAKITIVGKVKNRFKPTVVNFQKMLAGYRGDRFISYEHYLDLYYDKDSLYLYTQNLSIDGNMLPEYLLLARVGDNGSLLWLEDYSVNLSLRTYRYKLSDRLLAMVFGFWVRNADHPEFQLSFKTNSVLMIGSASE